MTNNTNSQTYSELKSSYDAFAALNLKLNMARGKPAPEQLDLSLPLLDILSQGERPLDAKGLDTRNYGELAGIWEARELMAQILEAPAAEVVVGNSSSLGIMYELVANAMLYGVSGNTPWSKQENIKFLCPCPGYDRHFAVTQSFGIQNIAIDMTSAGPDIQAVESLVANDASVKGIWCVPKYSNPGGVTYADSIVQRLAGLKPAAADFRIYWDNAYAVHDLNNTPDTLASLRDACIAAGNPDIYFLFASTSKVTFASAGIGAMSTSTLNIAEYLRFASYKNIGPDKIDQLRHVRFLRDLDGIKAHMRKHAQILAPKFAIVDDTLSKELGELRLHGQVSWSKPNGGYFISFDGPSDTAKRVVALAKAAGVELTGAGAAFPGGVDPLDRNIRIAPSYPSCEELKSASELFCICVKMAVLEKLEGIEC